MEGFPVIVAIVVVLAVIILALRRASPALDRLPLPDLERLYREGLSGGASQKRLFEIDAEIQNRDRAERERMKALRAAMDDGQLREFFEGAYEGGRDAASHDLQADARVETEGGVMGVLRARQSFDPPLRGLRQDAERILGWEAKPFLTTGPDKAKQAIVAYALWREGIAGVDLTPVRDSVDAWRSTDPRRARAEAQSLRGFKFPWLDFAP